jgi:sirohydrochlorin cobaltochelatase
MTKTGLDRDDLGTLETRLRLMLPAQYQDAYEDVQPVSMGTAGLKYGADGTVAWNEMWATFCDLAMAGGPPHKGTLLEPASTATIDAQFGRYEQVVDEICRGVRMVTGLLAQPSSTLGWVGVECSDEGMAGWLVRAIVMENVSARTRGTVLDLPAGPGYRLDKEIKNVITVVAKTVHYWEGHMPWAQQRAIGRLFVAAAGSSPLIEPDLSIRPEADPTVEHTIASALSRAIGLPASPGPCTGWLGIQCPSVAAAIWMMRGMVVSNVLARREGTVLFVPINPASDPGGAVVIERMTRIHGFAVARGLL